MLRCCHFIINALPPPLPPPFSGSASDQGFVESDGTSGHKKNVLTMLTMTGFMNSHAITKFQYLVIVQQDATVFSLLHFCRQLYMFQVLTPIIRSWYSCNYSFWY